MGYSIGSGGGGSSTYHGVSVSDTTAQSLANGSFTTLGFNTNTWDTDTFHSTSSNTSRITVPSTLGGKYLITAGISSNVTTDGYYWMEIRKNGVTVLLENYSRISATLGTSHIINGIVTLVATDYIECLLRVNAAASAVVASPASEIYLQASFVGA